jgi:hypothetical protein
VVVGNKLKLGKAIQNNCFRTLETDQRKITKKKCLFMKTAQQWDYVVFLPTATSITAPSRWSWLVMKITSFKDIGKDIIWSREKGRKGKSKGAGNRREGTKGEKEGGGKEGRKEGPIKWHC